MVGFELTTQNTHDLSTTIFAKVLFVGELLTTRDRIGQLSTNHIRYPASHLPIIFLHFGEHSDHTRHTYSQHLSTPHHNARAQQHTALHVRRYLHLRQLQGLFSASSLPLLL